MYNNDMKILEDHQLFPKHLYNGFIYMWVNKVNNKRYIGSHWGYEDDGYRGSGVLFKKAIKKYGIINFKRIIIEYRNYKDEKELREAENFYLKNLKVVEKSLYYNLTDCSGCSLRSEYSKLKQSQSLKGRKQSKETIQKRISKMKGTLHPSYCGKYVTPAGFFLTSKEAGLANNVSYRSIIYKCKAKPNDKWYFEPKEQNE
jgi:group I intron endonuclease